MTIVIEDITWKRAILTIAYRTDGSQERLQLFRAKSHQFVPLREEREGTSVRATLNIMQAFGREPLGDGEWILCRRIPAEEATLVWASEHAPFLVTLAKKRLWGELSPLRQFKAKCEHVDFLRYPFSDKQIDDNLRACPFTTRGVEYEEALVERLEELSRVFRYVEGKYACAASVLPFVDVTDHFLVRLTIDYYVKNYKPQTRRFSLRQLEKRLFSLYYRVARRILRSKQPTVLFLKENGNVPTENMAAVRDRIIERGLDGQFRIIERYRNTFKARQSLADWVRDINAIAKSDIVFVDDYCPVFNFIEPGESTTLVQLWHAGVGFKSVGYARFGILGSPDPYQSAHRRYSYALVGNENLRDTYAEVFGIEHEALLATGMPRLDHFLDEDRRERISNELRCRFPWMGEGRVVVFAPTFRGAGQALAYYPTNEFLDFEALWDMCERTNTYFVFKMHHFVSDKLDIPEEYRSRIFNLSKENLNDLLYVADVLVTDYSSCFYDYLLLKRPVVFYVPDKVEYAATRGVQQPIEAAPGKVCDTFEGLMDALEPGKLTAVAAIDVSMVDRASEQSGLASDRVIDTVLLDRESPGVLAKPPAEVQR